MPQWTHKQITDALKRSIESHGPEKGYAMWKEVWLDYFHDKHPDAEWTRWAEEIDAAHTDPVKRDMLAWEETLRKQQKEFEASRKNTI